MPRHTISGPLSVLLVGVFVIILLLASSGAGASPSVPQHGQPTLTWTPCDPNDEDDTCFDIQDAVTETAFVQAETADALTAAAEELTETAEAAYPYPGPATAQGTATATLQATGSPRAGTPTATRTPTATVPGGGTRRATPTTFSPDPAAATTTASVSAEAAPTVTPTPLDQLACVPGVPISITGQAPARAPLLLYFDQRAVGGGSASPNGDYSLTLLVGRERAGTYQVTVRVRGSAQVLRQLTCTVPAPTPLPTPLGRR